MNNPLVIQVDKANGDYSKLFLYRFFDVSIDQKGYPYVSEIMVNESTDRIELAPNFATNPFIRGTLEVPQKGGQDELGAVRYEVSYSTKSGDVVLPVGAVDQ